MKKTIAILIAVMLVCAGFGFWFRDHGIAKNGKDIAMIQEINPKKDSVLTVEHTAQDGQYELDESKTETLKNLLLAGKYRTISESVYQGTFQGDHLLLFVTTENDHVLTIEICGYVKMSVSDETGKKTEYYLIEDAGKLKDSINDLIQK